MKWWVLFGRRSRPWRTFIAWSGLLSRTGARLAPAIMDSQDSFARTGWAGTRTANSVCCAISTAEKARADLRSRVHRRTGAALLEKFRRVNLLLNDAWHTAPNHSRPASCVVKPRHRR